MIDISNYKELKKLTYDGFQEPSKNFEYFEQLVNPESIKCTYLKGWKLSDGFELLAVSDKFIYLSDFSKFSIISYPIMNIQKISIVRNSNDDYVLTIEFKNNVIIELSNKKDTNDHYEEYLLKSIKELYKILHS